MNPNNPRTALNRANSDIANARRYFERNVSLPPEMTERLLMWAEAYRELLRQWAQEQDTQKPGQ